MTNRRPLPEDWFFLGVISHNQIDAGRKTAFQSLIVPEISRVPAGQVHGLLPHRWRPGRRRYPRLSFFPRMVQTSIYQDLSVLDEVLCHTPEGTASASFNRASRRMNSCGNGNLFDWGSFRLTITFKAFSSSVGAQAYRQDHVCKVILFPHRRKNNGTEAILELQADLFGWVWPARRPPDSGS